MTDATPTASEAVAATATVPVTVAPLVGDVMLTVGAVVRGRRGGDATGADVPTLPAVSRASARRVWEPAATALVFQLGL